MVVFEINPLSDVPVWVQLRQRIIYLINTGYYTPGSQLPTVRKLAADVSINFNTVSKTYASLERDGYIRCTRKGAFVNEIDSSSDENDSTRALAEEYVNFCLDEGLSLDDVRKQINRVIKQIQKEREERNEEQPYE